MISIRQRLFFLIGTIVLLIFGLILLFNSLFLEGFYISQQENKLIDSYNVINVLENYDNGDVIDTYISIESSSNVDILVMNDEGDIGYSSNNYIAGANFLKQKADLLFFFGAPGLTRPNSPKNQQLPSNNANQRPQGANTQNNPLVQLADLKLLSKTDTYQVQKGIDPITGGQTIALIATLDNGHYLLLRTPLQSIRTNIAFMNQFLLIVLIIITVFATIATFILSGYFTKPIRQMNETTARLTALDFSKPCDVITKDELGQLAENINYMSSALEKNIGSLHDSNQHLQEEIELKTKLDKKRRELLNNVSHELKTPLALMQGYAEGLSQGVANDPDKIAFYCDVITDETLKMNQLVGQLLNIDQLEFGDIKRHPELIDFNTYLEDTLEKYMPLFNERHLKIKAILAQDTIVSADPLLLEQLLTNYITNAIRYCSDDGEVILRTIDNTDALRFEIYNTASPIDQNKLDKLFDSFYKLDEARSREAGGHGLGLSIVKAIQESEQLGFGCRPEKDGLTFWFDLKRA